MSAKMLGRVRRCTKRVQSVALCNLLHDLCVLLWQASTTRRERDCYEGDILGRSSPVGLGGGDWIRAAAQEQEKVDDYCDGQWFLERCVPLVITNDVQPTALGVPSQ